MLNAVIFYHIGLTREFADFTSDLPARSSVRTALKNRDIYYQIPAIPSFSYFLERPYHGPGHTTSTDNSKRADGCVGCRQ